MASRINWRDELKFHPGPFSRTRVRKAYAHYRKEVGLPIRCDNPACRFHSEMLVWNGEPLIPILDHINGVKWDNRADQLRYLCPNCDSQLPTRGGGNKGRVKMHPTGFEVRNATGGQDANVFVQGVQATASNGRVKAGSPRRIT